VVSRRYELSMNVGSSIVTRVLNACSSALETNVFECFREPRLSHEPSGDNDLTFGQEWRRRRVSRNPRRIPKIVEIMALASADGHYQRKRLTAATGSADAVLVVEPLGWHVCLKDGLEWADIDTDFHCGGYCEEVDESGAFFE